MDHVQVMAVGPSPMIIDTWQRRVGGVLKDLAYVSKGYNDDIKRVKPDLVVFYNNGNMESEIEKLVEGTGIRMLGLNLTLIPSSIKEIYRISKNARIGVLQEHLKCANILLSEILASGFFEHHFVTGTFDEMHEMDARVFLVATEVNDLMSLKQKCSNKKVIRVSRCLSPFSIAVLVNMVNQIISSKVNRK